MKASIGLIALCVIFGLAGCGSGETSSTDSSAKARPQVAVPKEPPPKRLVIEDLEKGAGPAVKAGDRVTVKWTGFFYKNGKEFFSSWPDYDAFTFTTHSGQVIPGWDRGMIGMKVGGRRKLIIPPALAYGDVGSTSVPPNETLIYVIDLLRIKNS